MDSIEFEEKLAEIESLRQEYISRYMPKSKRSKSYRYKTGVRKNDKLMQIVTRYYIPYAGYITGGFSGRTLLHSGKYIKHINNSNRQRYGKRQTNRIIRKKQDIPSGAAYRRYFDYYDLLY